MPKFVVIYQQDSGCDYTIGCGIKVSLIDGPDLDTAIANIVQTLARVGTDDVGDELAESLSGVQIYELAAGQVYNRLLPGSWLSARRTNKEKAATARAEAAERTELERLKKKYES